jgi:polar amino acid transport system substrate-binding protein
MVLTLSACGEKTHSEQVKKAGKLVVGVTELEPMNYKENGKWTGFDTEFATMFAKEKLGVEVEFVEIVWNERFTKLENGDIDCIWNGFTLNMEADEKSSTSKAYMNTAQVLVMKADRVGNYNDGYEIKDLQFAVQSGSEGAYYIIERNTFKNVVEVQTQYDALDMVKAGTADAAVVDIALANAVTGEGKQYTDLGIGFDFSSETYCVGFKKDSDLTQMLNDYMTDIYENELKELAKKYNLTLY